MKLLPLFLCLAATTLNAANIKSLSLAQLLEQLGAGRYEPRQEAEQEIVQRIDDEATYEAFAELLRQTTDLDLEQQTRLRRILKARLQNDAKSLNNYFLDVVTAHAETYERSVYSALQKILIEWEGKHYRHVTPIWPANLSQEESTILQKGFWELISVNDDPAKRASRDGFPVELSSKKKERTAKEKSLLRRYGLDELPDDFKIAFLVYPDFKLNYKASGYPADYTFSKKDFVFNVGYCADFSRLFREISRSAPTARFLEDTDLFSMKKAVHNCEQFATRSVPGAGSTLETRLSHCPRMR
ncbi:hypothetical protein K2X33_11005 [bacterium]|nr:hypothetical protein [bacterium]